MRRHAIALAIVFTAAAIFSGTDVSASTPLRRESLNAAARGLLQRADALQNSRDYAGALNAYMDAVRADRNAADIGLIKQYAGQYAGLTDLAAPPAGGAAAEAEQRRLDQAKQRETAALRQYLQLRPGDWDATSLLACLVELPEAEALFTPRLKARPNDPDLYVTRATIRGMHGSITAAMDDYEKAAALDPHNAERFYDAGAAAYDALAKGTALTTAVRRDLIKRALADLRRAEELHADYVEAMAYHALVLRQQALLETEPAVKKKLSAEADALHQRGMDLINKKRAAAQKH